MIFENTPMRCLGQFYSAQIVGVCLRSYGTNDLGAGCGSFTAVDFANSDVKDYSHTDENRVQVVPPPVQLMPTLSLSSVIVDSLRPI